MTKKTFSSKAIATSILAKILHPRVVKAFQRGPLTILMYHGVIDHDMVIPDPCMVSITTFRSQMRYLKKHSKVVSLTKAVEMLENDSIREPTVVITFDDGYQNNFDLAFPVLAAEHLPATIFLATLFVDTDTTIWTGTLQNAFALSTKTSLKWRGQFLDTSSVNQKERSLRAIKAALKESPQQSVLEEVQEIVGLLSDGEPIRLDSESPYRMLNSESIGALAESDLIELGAHTHSHLVLSHLSHSAQEVEIRQSLDLVQSWTGRPCKFFAYPNGTRDDYNEETLSILRSSGVTAALTTESGTCSADSGRLELERVAVGAEMDMPNFQISLFDIPNRIKRAMRLED
jgi:peptidoglycan/xylan/chitin deacetylase (PgdA/CDA1 family)